MSSLVLQEVTQNNDLVITIMHQLATYDPLLNHTSKSLACLQEPQPNATIPHPIPKL